jgi:GT2 family glycosyltransferase
MISIIIPFYNHWNLTHQRLMEMHKYAPDDCEIVLINDASTDLDCEGGVAFWQNGATRQPIRYHKNKKNLGFGGSMNKGAELAKGDILIFLSNDVISSDDWISHVANKLKENSNILLGGRIVYWPGGWNEFEHNGKKFTVPYCEGWLLACTREVWDNLGGFDPLYGKYAVEDIDLSTTAISLGYDLVGLNHPHIQHIGGATAKYDEHRMEYTKKNKEKYIEKWRDRFEEIFLMREGT